MHRPEITYAVAHYLHHRELHRFARSSTATRTIVDQAIRDFYRDKHIMLFSGFGTMMDQAELLNPATGEMQLLPELPMQRSSPSITVLGCDIFVCGGSDHSGRAIASVDRLDTVGMRWVAAPSMSTPRTMMVTGALQDTVYACGGADRDFGRQVWRSVEQYDASHNRWMDTPAMIERRFGAAAVVFKDCLYVFGGETNDGQTLKSVERFDPFSGQWQSLPPMSECREFINTGQDLSIAAVGDHLYVLDGMLGDSNNLILERLDTRTMTWECLQSPPVMCHSTALLACRGFVYACGGGFVEELDDDEYPCRDETNTEIQRFDPVSGQWSIAAEMEWMRSGCHALASAGRCTLRSSRIDFDSNRRRRGILGACLCSNKNL
eukprot:gnl/TRDRNA2_/TRDRNA2_88487_c0_seq4.p1 gnl/TRDRNA2_/TRDRNA2_88487_c0~~gnl/TRDRNA2_/TRDRNA2_88487_c0_seq4.p1  ORF type:complete len:378 (+),score=27.97 gnl/TRDRNA2_/TRDRNA2_88487_c0_seq4:74-1207(+)